MRRWRGMSAIVLLMVLAGAQLGRADSREADRLFARGRELMAAGETAEACAAFERSQALEAAVPTLLNLANCLEKAGRLATARAHFVEASQLTQGATDARGKALHASAAAHAARLEPLVSSLTLLIAEQRAGVALELLRDGQVVPAEQWNRAVPIDGGTYAIVARAPGAVEWTSSVSIKVQADQLVVEVPALAAPPKATESPASVPAPVPAGVPAPVLPAPGSAVQTAPVQGAPLTQPRPAGATRPTAPKQRGLFWPAAVGGAALVLGGSAAGVSWWASSTYSDAKAERESQARRDALERSATQRRYIAQGLAAASIGCAGVAVWLFLRKPGERPDSAEQARSARLWLVPSANGIAAAGWF